MNIVKRQILIFTGLFLCCLLFKLLPNAMGIERVTFPWNFSPLYAICLLIGATNLQGRHASWFRYCAPLLMLILGDIGIAIIGSVTGREKLAYHNVQLVVNASFLVIILLGSLLRTKRSAWAVGGAGFVSACCFFITTNFSMWALGNGELYDMNAAGLLACFLAAVPFFGHTLLAWIIYLPLFFNSFIFGLVEEQSPVAHTQPTGQHAANI